MHRTASAPRRSLSASEDQAARHAYDRWEANRQREAGEEPVERPITFNSAA